MATNRLESQQCNPYCWSKTLRHCISSLSKVQKVGQIATQTPLIHNVARAFNACTNLERDCDSMKPCSVEIPDSLGQNWSKRQPTRFLSRYFHSAIAACHLIHQGARSVELEKNGVTWTELMQRYGWQSTASILYNLLN